MTERASLSVRDLATVTGTTRQALHRHLSELVASGKLVAEGRGRATRYRSAVAALPAYHRTLATAGLAEDTVWDEARRALPELARPESANAAALLAHAFTEMLNNAIEHSGSPDVEVTLRRADARVAFQIADRGIGAFENVRAKLGLSDTLTALQELSKGKVSTDPERHSGEGIFFSSKMGDLFELQANGLAWIVDNVRGDHAIGGAPDRAGTVVGFEVSLAAHTTPEEIFARYTHDFVFDTTRAVVKLFQHGTRFVSRSEARRLLAGLEKFRQVILDFAGVEAVGQGFCDEVFRVWRRAHPEIALAAESMTPPVAFMVERARTAAATR